jgi:hypothetical protein
MLDKAEQQKLLELEARLPLTHYEFDTTVYHLLSAGLHLDEIEQVLLSSLKGSK